MSVPASSSHTQLSIIKRKWFSLYWIGSFSLETPQNHKTITTTTKSTNGNQPRLIGLGARTSFKEICYAFWPHFLYPCSEYIQIKDKQFCLQGEGSPSPLVPHTNKYLIAQTKDIHQKEHALSTRDPYTSRAKGNFQKINQNTNNNKNNNKL